jgi:hypothetical protein
MRLDAAVFVAPKPPVSAVPTRRAFLSAGGAFLLGAAAGGACGYSMGLRPARATPKAEASLDLQRGLMPTGDADLDALRRLAVEGAVEEIVARQALFLDQVRTAYHRDEYLWYGVERLVAASLRPEYAAWPQRVRQRLIQAIDGMDVAVAPPRAVRLKASLDHLRRVR